MNYQRQLLKNRKNHDPIKDLLLKISFVVDQMKKDSNKTLNIKNVEEKKLILDEKDAKKP